MSFARALPAARRDARIDLIFFDAGGGHRASATALKALADQQQRGWQVRMVNLRDILEPIDVFHRLTGVRVEDLYNRMLKYGLTIGTGPMLRAIQFLIGGLTRATWRCCPAIGRNNSPTWSYR